MINLFIDSSRKDLKVAITSDEKLIDSVTTESHGKHSNYLMPTINDIFKKNNIETNDIDNIIVVNGPGSFTGIRVGVTVAKVLAWTLSKKLYEITTLDALRVHADNDIVISVLFDKKDSSYVGVYEGNSELNDYMNIDDDRLRISNRNITIATYEDNEFVQNLKEKLSNNPLTTLIVDEYDYVKLINFALKEEPMIVHNSAPIYLKKIDAEKNK